MSTRAQVIVIEDGISLNDKFHTTLEKHAYMNIYQHSDGYPEGLGETLKEFLTSDVGIGRMHDIEYFCASLATYMMNRNRKEMIEKNNNTGFGMAKTIHGDLSYIYIIELDKNRLSCYDAYGYECSEKNLVFKFEF